MCSWFFASGFSLSCMTNPQHVVSEAPTLQSRSYAMTAVYWPCPAQGATHLQTSSYLVANPVVVAAQVGLDSKALPEAFAAVQKVAPLPAIFFSADAGATLFEDPFELWLLSDDQCRQWAGCAAVTTVYYFSLQCLGHMMTRFCKPDLDPRWWCERRCWATSARRCMQSSVLLNRLHNAKPQHLVSG